MKPFLPLLTALLLAPFTTLHAGEAAQPGASFAEEKAAAGRRPVAFTPAGDPLADNSHTPLPETRPWCYWYWMSDNIAEDGITRDLEAMARVGIGEALIGNTPYADVWLRKEIRRRLGQTGPDPVNMAIDAKLSVVRENGVLRLEPSLAKRSDRNDGLPSAILKPASELVLPAGDQKHSVDANSPAHWEGDTLHVFMSGGGIPKPLTKRATGADLLHLGNGIESCINNDEVFHHGRWGRWIEATHKDDESGNLYGWYHNEPGDCCPQLNRSFALTEPRIGALMSRDNGQTWTDLGFVLQAPPQSVECGTKNVFFAGGNGDFSVLLDARKEYFYFFFSSYWGEAAKQGIGVARMRYEERDAPAGKVFKWHNGRWAEPGAGGRLTPIFPAKRSWHQSDPDAFWGPSIHFNTHLKRYVILMNHAQDTSWKQEGIYVTFNSDLSNPSGWTEPQKVHSSRDWYPQIIGIGKGETDKLAGRKARFFLKGRSAWEIIFLAPGEQE